MKRTGQLTVTGTQWDETGGEQTTRTAASATYHTGGDSSYILYEENAPGGGLTKNMIKLKNGALELTKKGAVDARMVFEPGREHMTLYSTPFGSLPLGVLTETVETALSEKELRICAAYSLTCESPDHDGQASPETASQAPSRQGLPPGRSILSRCKIIIKMRFAD